MRDAYALSWSEFAARYPDFTTIDGYRRMRYRIIRGEASPEEIGFDLVKPPPRRKFDLPPRLAIDSFFFFSDFHAPYHNVDLLTKALELRYRRHATITDCIIGGDLFNFESISKHGIDFPHASLEEEYEAITSILTAIGMHFKRCWITLGNHDRRFSRRLDAAIRFQSLIDGAIGKYEGACEFIAVDHDYVLIDPEGDTSDRRWIVGHPKTYSRIGGSTPIKIAQVHRRNVICGHNHIIGVQCTPCGTYIGIDAGHMTDETRHHYSVTSMTAHPRWQAGFVVVDCGYPILYSERHTDWKRALSCATVRKRHKLKR